MFVYEGLRVLAIDETTRQLVAPLTSFFGHDADRDIDAALAALLWPRPKRTIVLRGPSSERIAELARTIHEHTTRKHFPFTQVTTVPSSDAAIEALCTRGGCGTLFLDLTRPVVLPATLVSHLFPGPAHEDHYHLGTIAVATTLDDARRCFAGGYFWPAAALGFPQSDERTAKLEVRR